MLIRGTFAVCPDCGADLNVRKNVAKIAALGDGLVYLTACSQCQHQEEITVSREVHMQARNYLREVANDKSLVDMIQNPVSPEETLLHKWGQTLDQMGDAELLAKFASTSN